MSIEWKPIDTAPKDGTWMLVYGEPSEDLKRPPIGITRWVSEQEEWWEQVSPKRKELVTKDASHWDYECEFFNFTHWAEIGNPE